MSFNTSVITMENGDKHTVYKDNNEQVIATVIPKEASLFQSSEFDLSIKANKKLFDKVVTAAKRKFGISEVFTNSTETV